MKQPSFFTQVLQYLYIKRRSDDAPHNTNLKFMHGMNRISIFMFLFAVVVIIYRLVIKR